MAKYTITENVHVDVRVDGADIIADFEPGVVELHPVVAALLTAQGVASLYVEAPEAPAKARKTKTPTEDTPTETPEA